MSLHKFVCQKLSTSMIVALLLVSFLLTPLLTLIPPASGASGSWWNDSWPYRKAIIIDRTKVGGILENFPVLIYTTDSNLANRAQPDGDDIVFVDAGIGSKLNYEIEYFDHYSGFLVAWVNVPFLSPTVDTILYMYYGNPNAESQQNPTAVWDTNYKMVLHLDEKTGTHYDSTVNGNNGAPYGGIVQGVSGKIDGADNFDGVNDYVEVPHSNSITGFAGAFTASVWFKLDDITRRQSILHKYDIAGNQRGWFVEYRTDVGKAIALLASSDGASFDWWYAAFNPTAGEWYYLSVVWQSNIIPKFYINGQQLPTSRSGTLLKIYNNFGAPLHIGKSTYNPGREFKGTLDEICLSNIVRSASWILTSYANQWNPSAFHIIGGEETPAGPLISNENPRNGMTNVYTNPTLSVDVEGTEPLTIIFKQIYENGTWNEIGRYSNVGNGKYSCIPTDMKKLGTKYYWNVSATDGDGNRAEKAFSFTTTTTILTPKWSKSNLARGEAGVLIADVNGDGLEEVIHSGAGTITCFKGTDGSVLWQFIDYSISEMAKPQMADLNLDGILEIIVNIAKGILTVHANNGTLYWKKADLDGGNHLSSPVVADIDGNGYPTIFVASEDVEHGVNGEGRLSSLSYDGRVLHQTFTWRPCFGGLSIADTDNDGEFEIFMGDRNDQYGDGNLGRGVRAFRAHDLASIWNHSYILCSSHIPMLADVNKDGILDVIAGHHRGGITVLNSRDGSIIKEQLGIPNDAPIHFPPSIYDIDLDGNLEILMADGTHETTTNDVVVWDLVQWKVDGRLYIGECYYGPRAADVTGDGIMEILAATYDGVYVIDRTYSVIGQVTGLGGPPEYTRRLTYPVVQDIDGDGYSELVITSYNGAVYAFDTPARRANPRPRSEVQFYSESRVGAAEYVPLHGPTSPVISDPLPLDGATSVPVTLFQLSFTLTNFQKNKMNYTVTTNPSIGSSSGINVGNGRYTVSISNLAYSTTYTWKINATDGKQWRNQTYRFTTESPAKWWNTNWQYRRQITIDPSEVSSDQTNFSVLIDLTDSSLPSKVQSDGDDFVFIDANQAKLDHEIELYDFNNGHLIVWVKVPFVFSTKETVLYMYYGNPNAESQQNPTAVWDTNYKMVLHLDEKTGTHYDSTVNGNNGAPYGGIVQGVSGKIDGADNFDGVNDYIEVPHSNSLTGFTFAFTVSFWLKLQDTTRRQTILNKYNTANNQRGWYIEFQTSPTLGKVLSFYASSNGVSYSDWYAPFNPTAGSWYYITLVWEANQIPRFYVNGIQVSTIGTAKIASIYNNTGAPLHIGRSTYTADRFLRGSLDEIRISNITRYAQYALTCFNNQKDPSAFYSLGTEESLPSNPIVSDPSPVDGATNVKVTLNELSFDLEDYQNDPMNYDVTTTPNIGSRSATGVGNGRYSVPVSGLQYSTTYTWHVHVTDGTHETDVTYTFTTEALIQYLVDSEFSDSVDSPDLRSNGPGQDWYESRGAFSGGNSTLLTLDTSDIGGNGGKKAALKNYGIASNAYLTQEFSSAQTGTFTVSFDIYIDRIQDVGTYDRTGHIFIGDDRITTNAPTGTSDERFVCIAFYDSTPSGTGTDIEIRARTTSGQAWGTTSQWLQIATGLSYDTWYTVKIIVNVASGTYDVYLNNVLKYANVPKYAGYTPTSVIYISFTADSDGRGEYYVDNVFSPAEDRYKLTVTTVGSGNVVKNPSEATYAYGTTVQLTATPQTGWSFSYWSGDLSGNTNPTTITMNGDKAVTATFTQNLYTLTIAMVGSGSVSKSPDQATYPEGTVVTLTATATVGWTFSGWSGDLTGSQNPATLIMDSNKVVTATFTQINYDDVIFDSSFEMGNLINVQYQSGDASGNRYYIATINYSTVGFADKHWWFYFSMQNTAGKTIKIELRNLAPPDFGSGDSSRWGNIEPVYSYNNKDWERLPYPSNVIVDSVNYRFTMIIIPTENKVWLAPIPPYTTAMRDALFAEFASSPYLTVSSLGTTPGGQPLKVATITDPVYSDTGKFKVYIIAQQHSGEVPSSWIADGLVRFLLGTDPAAAALRRSYIFKIVVITNVDGVYYGRSRYTPLRSGTQYDLNRQWSLAVTSMQPEIRWIYQDIDAWDPNVFIDLHSTVNIEGAGSSRDCMFLASTLSDPNLNTLLNDIAVYYPESCPRSTTPYAAAQVRSRLGVLLSTSMENPHDELRTMVPLRKLTTTDWMGWGEDVARGIYLYFGDALATLTVSTVGSGIVTKAPDQTTYTYGTIVTLTAIPDVGWSFNGWSGALSGTDNPAYLTMDGDKAVTATFTQDQYTLTFSVEGGGSVSKVPDQATYTYGSSVQLTASPEVGWSFSYWSGDLTGSANPATITITGNMTITAHFGQNQYTLTINVEGSGSVTKVPDQATYAHGTVVSLTAVPNAGWSFSGWSGDLSGNTNPTTITMDSTKSVTATFSQNQYTLTVTIDGTGTVTKSPDQTTYTHGTTVTLTATADLGWTFTGWSGDLSGSQSPVDIVMDGNKAVTATFAQDQYTLTVTIVGQGVVAVSPAGPYTYGAEVQLTATAEAGWSFDSWSGDLTGSDNPATVTMYNSKSITATFAPIQYTLTISTIGSGSVSKNPDQASYNYGTTVTLTATPSSGWKFSSWSGDLTGSQNPGTITMDGDKSVTATFIQNQVPVIDSYTPTVDYPCINQGSQQAFTISASDPDGDPLTKQWYLDGTPTSTADSYTFDAVSGTSGVHKVKVVVTDGYSGQTQHAWLLTVDANLVMPFDTPNPQITDYAGLDNNGTATGATWTPSGKINGAYSLDGVDDYIRIENSPKLGGDGTWAEITVELWIYISQDQLGSRVIAKRWTTSGRSYQIGFQSATPANRLYWAVWNPTTYQELTYTTPLVINTWYYVVCTYKSGEGLKIFVDGQLKATSAVLSGNIGSSTEPLYIGRGIGSTGAYTYFMGLVDEVKLYPKALTAAQIQQAYDQTKTGFTGSTQPESKSTSADRASTLALQLLPLPLGTLTLRKAKRKRKQTQ